MCWVVEPWMCSTTEISGFEKIVGYMIMKKSSFIVWWLVFELLNELLKAHLPLNKTATTKTNNYKHTYPTPPYGYKPTSCFSCFGSGADVGLNFCLLSVNGSERKSCRGIRKSWLSTWTRPVLRLTLIHWLRVSNRFPFCGKFVCLTYLRTIMKVTTISPS